jgi:hypothetical protein
MNETNHPARRLRHGDRPTEPLTFEDAAANKAAEEGGLPRYNIGSNGWPFNDPEGVWVAYEDIAADRASRQVANKAEIEQVQTSDVAHFVKSSIRDFADFREDLERLSTTAHRATLKRIRKDIYDTIDARVRNSVIAALASRATPPATTGASTVPDGWEPVYLVWSDKNMVWQDDGIAEWEGAAECDRRIAYQPKEVK